MLREKLVPLTENKMCADMQILVSRLLQTEEPFAVWGAGNTGVGAIAYLREHSAGKLAPQYIIDNNPSMWDKGEVLSPDKFFAVEELPKVILVCVYVADQVVRQIKQSGYKGEIIVFSTSLLFDDKKEWQMYGDNMPVIEEVYGMLADDRSRETLAGFLNCIRTGDLLWLKEVNGDDTEKLLDPTILRYTENEMFVDIGAFTGDTILKFLELTKQQYKRIVGIELDRQNYSILREVAEKRANIEAKNVAVGAGCGTMHYVSKHSESCVLSEEGDGETKVVALDDLPEVQDATFIKVSANGMELPILQGAVKLLRRNTPKLAIYASGRELWEIPCFLKELVPEYELYYRHYGYGRQAMICYAVRKQ